MYPSGEEYDAVNNRLVIADTGRDRVLIYSLTGTRLSTFGSYGTGNGQFASPRDIAVDDVGNIYVADAENNRIQAFTATGTFRWKAGGLQQGADTLNTPIGLTWDSVNDVLLVASTGQSLVKAYSAAGARLWNSPTGDALGAHAPRDVARGPDGRIWITAYREHQVRVYNVSADGRTWTNSPVFVLGDGATGRHGHQPAELPLQRRLEPERPDGVRLGHGQRPDRPLGPHRPGPPGVADPDRREVHQPPAAVRGPARRRRKVQPPAPGRRGRGRHRVRRRLLGCRDRGVQRERCLRPLHRGVRAAGAGLQRGVRRGRGAGRAGLRHGPAQPPHPAVHGRGRLRQPGRARAAPSRPRSPGRRGSRSGRTGGSGPSTPAATGSRASRPTSPPDRP